MPPIEETDRYQDAVLWTRDGSDRLGQPLVSSVAVGLLVRWRWKKRNATTNQTEETAIDATAQVDRTIAVGSLMALGSIEDLPAGTGGLSWSESGLDICEVVSCDEVRDIKGRETYREVSLRRYRGSLASYSNEARN